MPYITRAGVPLNPGNWGLSPVDARPDVRSPYAMTRARALAGRVGELQTVTRVLTDEAEKSALLVTGEPGVGKSRLLAAAAGQVASKGVLVLPGWCLAMSDGLPLLPIVELLRALERAEGGAIFELAVKACPRYVHGELTRLLPELADGDIPTAPVTAVGVDDGWRRRLFEAVRWLLAEVRERRSIALVVEDLHWADSSTLEFLEYLLAPSSARDASPLVITCRSGEPIAAAVTQWLERAQRNPQLDRLYLAPLTRVETAEQIELITGGRPGLKFVDRVHARSEGNAFFTEQLVAAVRESDADTVPAGLTSLLLARTSSLSRRARDVLAALAVAARPLEEAGVRRISSLDEAEVSDALEELSAARLLRAANRAGRHQLRHALLAEAVTGELLPSHRQRLHGAVADVLADTGDDTLAAEIADHLRAAGRVTDEPRWRVKAAHRAQAVFAWRDAADHWLRVLHLHEHVPADALAGGLSLPGTYAAAEDALDAAGDETASRELAQEALARFASSDPATRAELLTRAGWSLARAGNEDGFDLLRRAITVYEQLPPCVGHARALRYLAQSLYHGGHPQQAEGLCDRAVEVAESAGNRFERLICLSMRATAAPIDQSSVELITHVRAELDETDPPDLHAQLAARHAFILDAFGRHAEIRELGLPAIARASNYAIAETRAGDLLYHNVAESLLELGLVHVAAEFLDPLTDRTRPTSVTLGTHAIRAQLDLLRGRYDAAAQRWAVLRAVGPTASLGYEANNIPWEVEFHLWNRDIKAAVERARYMLARIVTAEGGVAIYQFLMVNCFLLLLGLRGCAAMAENACARLDDAAVAEAQRLAAELDALRRRIVPRPFEAADPAGPVASAQFGTVRVEAAAETAQWRAEFKRLDGEEDATLWRCVAEAWEALGRPHRAAYARWRQASALLAEPDRRHDATQALRKAADEAREHQPLSAAIDTLAHRARIDLQAEQPAAATTVDPPGTERHPFALTERELSVLRLLADGRTNAEIGAALFMSAKTASVHVTHILRKLDVTSRVQAAAVAERAGLLTPAENPANVLR